LSHPYVVWIWTALLVLWIGASFTAKRTESRQDRSSRALHIVIELVAFYLLLRPHYAGSWLNAPLCPDAPVTTLLGWTVFLDGLAFTLWARSMLGRDWSAHVTIKVDHTLIRSGPYAIVRHPIYAGLVTAMLGTAIIENELHAYLAVPIALLGWKMKSVLEERFMARQFGAEYVLYKQQVKGIVPYFW
jgi:protein-S-isoprenylcysteine O-methyltransferase Ste14